MRHVATTDKAATGPRSLDSLAAQIDHQPLKFHRSLDDISSDVAQAITEKQPDERIDELVDEYETHPTAIARQAEYDAADAVVEELDRQGIPLLCLSDF